MKEPREKRPVFFSILLSYLITMALPMILLSFLFRLYYRIPRPVQTLKPDLRAVPVSSEGVLDDCIMNGFETITRIGGYMMLFAIIISLAELLCAKSALVSLILLPSLEITNGVPMICSLDLPYNVRLIGTLALTSFGGWCALAQTKCMIAGTGLSIKPYIIQKLITAAVTSLLCLFYLHY